jgi:hypothetical protein
MAFKKFYEYLDEKNKLHTQPKVKQVPDYEGKIVSSPEAENKHKEAGGHGMKGKPAPYMGGKNSLDPNKNKMADGFASKGDRKNIYTPTDGMYGGKDGISKSVEGVPGGKKAPEWKPTKTQEWIESNKNVPLAQLAKKIREENLKGLDECDCSDMPHSAIKKAINICQCNKKHLSTMVREMKRQDLLKDLVAEMAQHDQTFDALASLIKFDETYGKKLEKALVEAVAPPIGEDEPTMPLNKKKNIMPSDMGDEDMGDEDMSDEDMSDEDMGDEDMGDEDMGDEDMGDEDMSDEDMGDEDMSDEDMGDEDMGDEDMGDEDMGDEDMSKGSMDSEIPGSFKMMRRKM